MPTSLIYFTRVYNWVEWRTSSGACTCCFLSCSHNRTLSPTTTTYTIQRVVSIGSLWWVRWQFHLPSGYVWGVHLPSIHHPSHSTTTRICWWYPPWPCGRWWWRRLDFVPHSWRWMSTYNSSRFERYLSGSSSRSTMIHIARVGSCVEYPRILVLVLDA